MTDTALNQLIARASLQDLVADYASVCDWLDWEVLDRVFWPEAQFDFGMFKGDLPAYRDFVKALEEPFARRIHMFGLPLVRIHGNRARVDVGNITVCRTAAPEPGVDDMFVGRYLFDAECRDGEWRFVRLTYLLNLAEHVERKVDDSNLPLNFSEGLSTEHPLHDRRVLQH